MNKKDSTLPYLNTSISWGVVPAEPLSMKVVDARPKHTTKQISFQDQDSSSTQSTGQSYTDIASSGDDDNPSRQISFSTKSGQFLTLGSYSVLLFMIVFLFQLRRWGSCLMLWLDLDCWYVFICHKNVSFSLTFYDVWLGSEETQHKGFATHPKPGSMTGLPSIHFAPTQANFSFHYADPQFGGLLAATYLPQAPVSVCNESVSLFLAKT